MKTINVFYTSGSDPGLLLTKNALADIIWLLIRMKYRGKQIDTNRNGKGSACPSSFCPSFHFLSPLQSHFPMARQEWQLQKMD